MANLREEVEAELGEAVGKQMDEEGHRGILSDYSPQEVRRVASNPPTMEGHHRGTSIHSTQRGGDTTRV